MHRPAANRDETQMPQNVRIDIDGRANATLACRAWRDFLVRNNHVTRMGSTEPSKIAQPAVAERRRFATNLSRRGFFASHASPPESRAGDQPSPCSRFHAPQNVRINRIYPTTLKFFRLFRKVERGAPRVPRA